MSRFVWRAGAVAVALLASPSMAFAQSTPAIAAACDGYGAFSKTNDGLTVGRALLGGPRIDQANATWKSDAHFGEAGLKACDTALAMLPDGFWLRKVSLIRSRALHHLALKQTDAALADLDLAVSTAKEPDDLYFKRSIGFGNDLIRAYALRQQGKETEATALALSTWRQRPYNRLAGVAALAAMGDKADQHDRDEVFRGMALLNPVLTDELFWSAMEDRRFPEAIALFPALVAPHEYGDEPMTDKARAILEVKNQISAEEFWAHETGAYAYALAATGKTAEARDILNHAREKLRSSLDQIGKGAGGNAPDYVITARNEQIPMARTEGNDWLDGWMKMVDQREMADKSPEKLLTSLETDHISNTPISIDILDTLLHNLPPQYANAGPAITALEAQLGKKTKDDPSGDLRKIYKDIPDPEFAARVTGFSRKANGWSGDMDSYRVDARPDGTTVTYRGVTASPQMVEELALLHATDQALKAGRKGLIITGRKDYEHTLSDSAYGAAWGAAHTGYDTRLDVVYVDPDALPDAYKAMTWRVIDAAKVYRELGPIYGAPVQVAAGR